MPKISPTQLRTALSKLFNTGELRTLCFDLGIEYEDLEGAGKSAKALALVQYAQRHGRYDELVYRVQQLRPHTDLGAAVAAPSGTPAGGAPGAKGPAPVTKVYVSGDFVGGDKVGGDKVGGDKTMVGGDMISAGGDVAQGDMTKQTAGGDIITAGRDVHINADPQNKAEFAETLKGLKQLLEQALADGEIDREDGETAVSDLQDVIEETEKETPRASRMKRRLEDISEVISAAAKTGAAVLRAAPVIAGLIKVASIIF